MAFPQTPNDVAVELYYDATWNSITSYVYQRRGSRVAITRGRSNEASRVSPGRLMLQLNNRDGRFSPRNPNSPLYGKIGRNTPIRVKVTYNAVTYIRFVGEVSSWPSRWDVTGRDVWVPLEASGIMRRLNQGSKPIRSPLYRTMLGGLGSDIPAVAYWPMEDGTAASQFASPIAGVDNMTVISPTTLSNSDEIPGSGPLPVFGVGSGGRGPIPAHTDTGFWVAQAAAVTSNFSASLTVLTLDVSGGTAATVSVGYNVLQLIVAVVDVAGGIIGSNIDVIDVDPTGVPVSVVVAMKDNASGTDDFAYARMMTGDGTVIASIDVNLGPGVYGRARALYPNGKLTLHDEGVIGHVAYYTDASFVLGTDDVQNALAVSGHAGETAEERFSRVCAQSSIPYVVTGTSGAEMAGQRQGTLPQVLRDAEDVDQGLVMEQRDALGLKLRTNSSRYGQTAVALDYSTGQVSPPFEPEPDDYGIFNDREVQRRDGSSARMELSEGALSTQDPPDGVGRYDDSITVDAYTDDQVAHIASWRLHLGTWDAERYPQVRVDFARNPSLISAVTPLDSGDLLTITNLPSWLPPEDAELLVEGYRETIGSYAWDITFNTSPAGPYNVVGRWALLSKELHAAINSSTTSIDVANTDVTQPMLATSAADIGSSGYGITIGGEELQLTAVAASTITYGAVGTASHANNANVTPGLPASLAQGNLMVMLAAIRNSGAGVPSTPAGWTRLAVFPTTSNVQVFAKIAGSSESAPTVSFTGGVLNADTSAQIIRLAGKWHSASNILISSASCLNTSAQNITYPGLSIPSADNAIILAVGWKQDDWTSVATLSGMTEIAEATTVTGDDQGIVWDYVIQTTATAVASSAFTVTGGVSAISRGALLALRCDYQTATVTRSTNGITASHSAADAVTLTRPMRWGLV